MGNRGWPATRSGGVPFDRFVGLTLAAMILAACGDSSGQSGAAGNLLGNGDCRQGAVTTIAAAEHTPLSLCSDGSSFYWSAGVADGVLDERYVRRAALDGNGAATLHTTAMQAASLAVYDGALYWGESTSTGTNGVIYTSQVEGGPVVPLHHIAAPELLDVGGIAVNAAGIYWLTHDPSGALPVDRLWHAGFDTPDGGAVLLAEVTGLVAVAPVIALETEGSQVFWALSSGSLYTAPLAGGEALLLTADPAGIGAFAVGPEVVLYTQLTPTGPIYSVPRDGSTPATLFSSDAGARWSLLWSDNRVIFSTLDDQLRSTSTSGGPSALITASGVRTVRSMLLENGVLYWANATAIDAGGAVRSICLGND